MPVTLIKSNKTPDFWCPSCGDEGGFEIYHPSTDAVIGWQPCRNHKPYPQTWNYFQIKKPLDEALRRAACPF